MTAENSNIRAEYYGYFVTHAYMSPIQHGIQSAHVIQAMYKQYSALKSDAFEYPALAVFDEWMKNDMTMIVLNGGNSASINASMNRALVLNKDQGHPYPISSFYEDYESMEGMMTCWGIVLPKVNREDYTYDPACDSYTDMDGFAATGSDKIYMEVLSHLRLA